MTNTLSAQLKEVMRQADDVAYSTPFMVTTFSISNRVFPIPLRIICGDGAFIQKCFKRFYKGSHYENVEGYEMCTLHIENKNSDLHEIVIIMEDVNFTCDWYGSFSHECVHFATNVMSILPIPINKENDEVLAYLTGWAMRECLIEFRLRDKSIKDALQKKKVAK